MPACIPTPAFFYSMSRSGLFRSYSPGIASGRWGKLAAGLVVIGSISHPSAGNPDLAEGWRALSIGSALSALDYFPGAGTDREALLGASIAGAQLPPITPGSLARASRQLEELARGADETAHAAAYHLGRIIQFGPFAPDPVAASEHFEKLVATGADDRWCRLALLKLALLQLTVLPEPGGMKARLAKTNGLFPRTANLQTRRDLHLIIAEVRLSHGLYDAATLAHLNAAAAIGGLDDSMHGDLLIQQARLSTELGEVEAARGFYGEFLRLYPKDSRHFTVQGALAALPGQL